jgi:hypothetical protein
MAGQISGTYVAVTAAGAVLVWSGWQGATLAATFKGLLAGNLNAPATEGVTSPAAAAQAGNTGAETTSAAANQAIAQQVIAADSSYAGWGSGADWQDLLSLWNQESGWSNTADNPTSGAYGIPQALPAAKMPAAAQAPPAGTSDARTQIEWGLSYIASTYGNPQMAWAHELANGWY